MIQNSLLNTSCNGSCTPPQIITFNTPFSSPEELGGLLITRKQVALQENSIEELNNINNKCNILYNTSELNYAYSLDGTCWSCYANFDTTISALYGVTSDFFLRIKVSGPVYNIFKTDSGQTSLSQFNDWSVSLMSGFNFSYVCSSNNANLYNPYANMDCAIQLQTQLAETVSCMFGIPVYYFKVNGVNSSADVTFKEYALKSVESVKQVKLMIKDGAMPSSKPEFSDLGLDFQTDWEVEITKGTFATAFGSTAQPQEGDFIYIPMMKRMWSVTGSWEEKNQSLMWVGTSFKLTLVKYQDDTSINKDNVETLVNDIVKTKYEDLFGDEETLDSGTESAPLINGAQQSLHPVFESDSCRKSVSEFALNSVKNANTNNSSNLNNTLYYKGTQICDSYYDWNDFDKETSSYGSTAIVYQRQYCGSEFSISFLININSKNINNIYNKTVISIGSIKVNLKQENNSYYIYNQNLSIELKPDTWYFIVLRGSKQLNTSNLIAATYKYPEGIPVYKVQKFHYYFDIDNATVSSGKFSEELNVENKTEAKINHFTGLISNFKLLNIYNDNLSELLMQNPTNQHLLINDTAMPFLGLYGPNQY